jgi:hypothetical protein
MAHRRQGLIGIASCCLLLVLLQTITLAQGSSISGTGDPRFSRAQERQALQIICRNGYLEFMMNPCTNDRLDQPAERDKAVRLYGYAVGEIAARLDISKEQSLALIHSITNVDMAKRFATGEFTESDCPAPDNDPPISEAEEVKARQTTCQLLEVLGNKPSSDRIAQLSDKAEDQFCRTMCISPPRGHRIMLHVRNEFLTGKVSESDCATYLKQ